MNLPQQSAPVLRLATALSRWRPAQGVAPSDNLCTCPRGNRMCPEHKECECVDGYPRCVD